MANTNWLQNLKKITIFLSGVTTQHYLNKMLDYNEANRQAIINQNKEDALKDRLSQIDNNLEAINTNVQNVQTNVQDLQTNIQAASDLSEKVKDMKISEILSENLLSRIEIVKEEGEKLKGILDGEISPDSFSTAKIIVHKLANDTNEILKIFEDINSRSKNFLSNFNVNDIYDFLSNFNLNKFYDFLDSLSLIQESAFLHILFFIILLCIGFNILGVLFGNEIIKYFNIDKKYPSLTTILKLRNTFQRYYLLWSIFVMFIVCTVGIGINILTFYSVS